MNDDELDGYFPTQRSIAIAVAVAVAIVVLFVTVIAVLATDRDNDTLRTVSTQATVGTDLAPPATSPVSTITEIVEAAEADTTALRVDPPDTTIPPPPDPCTLEQYVNEIQYRQLDPGPSTENYRIVAACLGWTVATIDFYQDGVNLDIIHKESSNCPIIRGHQSVTADCVAYTPQGVTVSDDTGFFQITRAGWGQGATLCVKYGYCSWQSIIQSPWHSMRAGLLLIMEAGRQPWTWVGWACEFHWLVCSTWPEKWENLP